MTPTELQRRFILQQGLPEPEPFTCSRQYSALLFQPRVIGVLVSVGALAGAVPVFAGLAAALFWSAALPRLSPFDATYNALFAARTGQALGPAPGPRRFAQALAGALCAGIAAGLATRHTLAAHVLEGVLLAAVAMLVFGGFCFGSFVFHVLRGRARHALRTLPWAKG